jgi:hypothetical protein
MKKLSVLGRQLPVSGAQSSASQTQLSETSQKSLLPNNWQLATSNWLLLLVPRFFALRNGLRRRTRSGKIRAWVLATLMMLFWAGAFWFFQRILGYFQTIPDLGPVLSQKLLNMIFLTFLAILTFSNMVTGLSTFHQCPRHACSSPSLSRHWSIRHG